MRRLLVGLGLLAVVAGCVLLLSDLWVSGEVLEITEPTEEEVESYCLATGRCIAVKEQADEPAKERKVDSVHKEKQRLIFVASHGHSGTRYLKDVLAQLSNVTAFHEQEPRTVGMAEARLEGMAATYATRMGKVEALLAELEAEPFSSSSRVYCDTTHQFLLTWPDVITDYFHVAHPHDYDLTIVVLRREMALTVRSHTKAPEYRARQLPSYAMLESLPLDVLEAAGISEAVDDAISYVVDVELRLKAYREAYPNVRIVEVRLEDLQTEEGVRYLGQMLGLSYNDTAHSHIGHMENRHVKPLEKMEEPVERYRAMVEKWLVLYRAAGVALPPVPARSCVVTQCSSTVVKGEKNGGHARPGGKEGTRAAAKVADDAPLAPAAPGGA